MITDYFPLISAIFVSGLGLFTLSRHWRKKVNIIFFFLCFVLSIWLFATFKLFTTEIDSQALFWDRIVYIGVVFVPTFIYHIALIFTDRENDHKVSLYLGYFLSTLFLIASRTEYFVTDLFYYTWGVHTKARLIHHIFLLFFSGYILVAFYFLYAFYRVTTYAIKKVQAKYMLLALIFLVGIGSWAYLPAYGIGIYPFSYISGVIFSMTVAYAILRYRLLDIRFIITRSLIYFQLIGFVFAFYVLLTFLIARYFQNFYNLSTWLVALFISTVIVVTFDPFKKLIAIFTDNIFYKARIDYQVVLRGAVNTLNTELELGPLVGKLTETVRKELKLKGVALLLPDQKGSTFSSDGFTAQRSVKLSMRTSLGNYLKKEQDILVLEEFQRKVADILNDDVRTSYQKIEKDLEKLDFSVVVPVVVKEKLLALLMVGGKLSGDPFGNDDINFFEVLAPQIGNSITKAKLYDQVKQFNIELTGKIEEATNQLKNTNVDLERRNHFLSALQHVTNLTIRSLDFQKVAQIVVDEIQKELGYLGGILYFADPSKRNLQVRAITNSPLTKKAITLLPKEYSLYKVAVQDTKSLVVKSFKQGKIQEGDAFRQFTSRVFPDQLADKIHALMGMGALVAVPIFDEVSIVGVLLFAMKKSRGEITDLDRQMMRALADQTGIFARNLRLVEQIKKYNERLHVANDHLRELDKAKSEFMSIASHQLRTPMTGIMGYLSMLVEGDYGKFSDQQGTVLKNILQASQRMIRLVNVFLNVTRIESGRLRLQVADFDIIKTIEEEVRELLITAEVKQLKLEFKGSKEKLPIIQGDLDKIKDVVINLIDNAIKYTPEGSITVTARKDPEGVYVSVRDTGVGIEKGEDKKLFQKFVRGAEIARIHPDGSGLGLFIAKKIIEAHGGRIWVDSEGKGKGSNFQFVLPVKLPADAPIRE